MTGGFSYFAASPIESLLLVVCGSRCSHRSQRRFCTFLSWSWSKTQKTDSENDDNEHQQKSTDNNYGNDYRRHINAVLGCIRSSAVDATSNGRS